MSYKFFNTKMSITKFHMKHIFIFFTLLTLSVMLFGILPASLIQPVYADSLASPLFASGDFVWAKNMGGTGGDFGSLVTVDSSGNIYTTGAFQGTADFDPGPGTFNLTSAGGDDFFVSKSDNSGNLVWAKNVGGNSAEAGSGIAVDVDGNVYTTGYYQVIVDFDPGAGIFELTPQGRTDVFVLKLDSGGNFVWAKSMGGTGTEFGNGLVLDSSSNVYTTGSFQDIADFDPSANILNLVSAGATDIFLSKLDRNGNFVWAKSMNGTNGEFGVSIGVDSSDNIYTTGLFFGTVDFDPDAGTFELISAGLGDIFVSKLNSNGNLVWAKSMGGSFDDQGIGIAIDSSGNVYTTGYFIVNADFDPGAGTFNLTSAGPANIFVSKLDNSGNFVWAKSIGGTSDGFGLSIAVDSSRNVYTTGYFQDTTDFDPGAGVTNLTTSGLADIFISKLDINGDFVWAKTIGGIGYDFGIGITMDTNDNLYTTGSFEETADFDPGPTTANLTSTGGGDIFITKLEGNSNQNQVTQVTIDIKPGDNRNRIEIEFKDIAYPYPNDDDEKISVAILSMEQFNAIQQVDRKSLTFGSTGDETSLNLKGRKQAPDCKTKDVNKDKLPDLVCKFMLGSTGFQLGDTEGILKGLTVDGTPIEGSDSVIIKIDD